MTEPKDTRSWWKAALALSGCVPYSTLDPLPVEPRNEKMTDPYNVEIDPECERRGGERKWWIVGPDGRGLAMSYDDLGDAIEIADCLNDAYHLGQQQASFGRTR